MRYTCTVPPIAAITPVAIGEQVQQADADADAPRRLRIAADGKQLAPKVRLVQQQPVSSATASITSVGKPS